MKKVILSICIILSVLIYFNIFEVCFGKNTKVLSADYPKKELKIGDSLQGGIIAYILKETDPGYDPKVPHGLIAARNDQSKGIQWYNGDYAILGASGTALGTGAANTDSIIKHQGEGKYAAKLCADLVVGQYSDWYLPSKDELNLLYLSKNIIGGFTAGEVYWTSTEDKKVFYAWRQGFFSGSQASDDKKVVHAVRAVRSF